MTAEPRAAAAAREAGAHVVDDPAEAGHSEAALLGVARPRCGAARSGCCSCPATARRSTRPRSARLLARDARAPAEAPRRVVIVSDRHGSGTNALLLTPPGVDAALVRPGLARPPRRAGGRRRRRRPRRRRCARSQLDVDTPGDLAALRDALGGLPGRRAAHPRAARRSSPGPPRERPPRRGAPRAARDPARARPRRAARRRAPRGSPEPGLGAHRRARRRPQGGREGRGARRAARRRRCRAPGPGSSPRSTGRTRGWWS